MCQLESIRFATCAVRRRHSCLLIYLRAICATPTPRHAAVALVTVCETTDLLHFEGGDHKNRARQLYKNISMLFLFPVKDGKLSTGVNATFHASCYG